MKKLICTLGLLFSIAVFAQQKVTLILMPTPEAAKPVLALMKNPQKGVVSDVTYIKGQIHKKPVVAVISGYGEVNMINITSLLTNYFHPKLLIHAEPVTSNAAKQGTVFVTQPRMALVLKKKLPYYISSDLLSIVPMDANTFKRLCKNLKVNCLSIYAVKNNDHLASTISAIMK